MDDEPLLPRLLIDIPGSRVEDIGTGLTALVEAGVDGLLIDPGNPPPPSAASDLRVLAAPFASVLLVGSPRLAGEAGTGLLLPESGMAAAEARRQITPGALLAREVASVEAAARAVGVDLLVMPVADGRGDRLRRGIESAAAPVLWRVAGADEATAVLAAGGEGVVLPVAGEFPALLAEVRRVAAALPRRTAAERVVLLDGVAVPLPPETSVTDLLADAGRSRRVVRRNGIPVPRRAWDDTLLAPGDVIETDG